MICLHHIDLHVEDHLATADAHWRDALDPFFLHPGAEFEDADHDGIVFLGERDRVADVIEVSVSAEQRVDAGEFFHVGRR